MGLLDNENIHVAVDGNGSEFSGARRYVYLAGTDTLASLYSDPNLTNLHANPNTADSSGVFPLSYVVDGVYRVVIKDSNGNALQQVDDILIRTEEARQILREFRHASEVLADQIHSYTEAPGKILTFPGDLINVVHGQYTYVVADAGATDHHLTTQGGLKLYVQPGQRGINVCAFGAGLGDDTTAFKAWMDVLERDGGDYIVPRGTYSLSDKVIGTITASHTRVFFEQGAQIVTDGTSDRSLGFNAHGEAVVRLANPIARGDTSVTFLDAATVSVGDLFYFFGSEVVETTFGSNAMEVNVVSGVSGNTVSFEKPFTFDHGTGGGTIFNYKNRTIEIYGLDMICNNARGVALTGFKYPLIDGFKYHQTNRPLQDNGEEGIYSQRNWCPRFNRIKVEYAKYGVSDHTNYGLVIDQIDAFDCRHPVDPNSLSQGTLIKNMTARNCNSAIQSHAALDVVYDGFLIEEDRGRPINRATGGALRNGKATYITDNSGGQHCLLVWAPGQEHMRDRSFEIVNVVEHYPATTNPVLTVLVSAVRRVFCQNYTTAGFSVGDCHHVEDVMTVNCRWAHMRGAATKTNLHDNLIFDTATSPAPVTTAITLNGMEKDGIAADFVMRGGGVAPNASYNSFIGLDHVSQHTVTGATGTGSEVTLTFDAADAAFPVGSAVAVSGMTPAAYDGIYKVLSATTTSVTLKGSATGVFVSGGTVQAHNARVFDGVNLSATNLFAGIQQGDASYRIHNCDLEGNIPGAIAGSAYLLASNNQLYAGTPLI